MKALPKNIRNIPTSKLAAFLILLGVASLVAFASGAKASTSLEALPDNKSYGDFVVGPGKVETEMAPGETKTFELTVSNRLGTDKVFNITEEDFKGSEDPNQTVVLLGDDHGPYSLRDFVTVGTSSMMIPQGHRARISITIKLPENAEPGGLYGSVLVGTASNRTNVDSLDGASPTSPIITRIGTLFFVRVKGAVLESGHLEKFSLAGDKAFYFETKPMVFNILFRNTGNVSVNPKGTITITNMLGSPIGTIEVDPWFAMPQSLRFREVNWESKFLFGRYTAKAEILRGYGSTTDEATFVFWVIPLKIILLALAGLIIIVGGLRFVFKRFKISIKPVK